MTSPETHRSFASATSRPMPRLVEMLRARVAAGDDAEEVLTEFQIKPPAMRQAYLDKLGIGVHRAKVDR